MARTCPVPIYSTTTTFAQLTSVVKTLSTSSPGSTDSTATQTGYALAARQTFLIPEQTRNGTADVFPKSVGSNLTTTGGLAFEPIGPLTNDTGAGIEFEAGTWSFQFPMSRTTGLTDSDVTGVTLRAQLVRLTISGNVATVAESIGTASKTGVTITGTETAHQLDITGAACTLNPGDKLCLLPFWEWPIQVSISGTARCHTASTSAARITAAPRYRLQYHKSHAHSVPLSQAQFRKSTYRRRHDESIPLTQAQLRRATFPRSHAEAVPAPIDDQRRRVEVHRTHAEAAPITDAQFRRATYRRRHDEALSEGGGATIKRPIYIFED